MKVTITGKGVQVSNDLKDKINQKLEKFKKFFESSVETQVTFSYTKSIQICEVTMFIKNGVILRGEFEAEDKLSAFDGAIDRIFRQIKKHKTGLEKQFRKNTSIRYENIESLKYDDDEEDFITIVRSKRFGIKPMSAEEAVLQMNMLNHEFFVFLNDKSEEVNVVYKRKNEAYGLIEPQF